MKDVQVKIGYMCKTDFEYHLGNDMFGVEIYPTLEDIKREKSCVVECGIVKVKIVMEEIVEKGTI